MAKSKPAGQDDSEPPIPPGRMAEFFAFIKVSESSRVAKPHLNLSLVSADLQRRSISHCSASLHTQPCLVDRISLLLVRGPITFHSPVQTTIQDSPVSRCYTMVLAYSESTVGQAARNEEEATESDPGRAIPRLLGG